MLEDAAALSQLLLDWDDAGGPASAGASSNGEELLDFFEELRSAPCDAPSPDENTDGAPPRSTLSRSSLCRRRQREEIKRLREEVAALKTQCEHLRADVSAKRPPSDESDVLEMGRPPSGVWARIAKHQHELKLKAECENAKLRALLDEHSKLAQRIEKAIHNRALEAQTKQEVEKRRSRDISALHGKTAERWKVTAASPQWQRIFHIVFHNDSLWTKELERDLRLNISTAPDGGTVVEAVYAQVFPFDLAKTSEATWRSYKSNFIALTGGYFAVTSATDKLLSAEIQATLDIPGKSVIVESDVLIHKVYEAPERVVFVWENWSPTDDGCRMTHERSNDDTSTIKVRMTMDLCVAIEEIRRDTGDHDGPATVMRVYSVSRQAKDSIHENPIRVTREGLIQSYYDSNRRFSELVETYLLDDALGLGTTLTASA